MNGWGNLGWSENSNTGSINTNPSNNSLKGKQSQSSQIPGAPDRRSTIAPNTTISSPIPRTSTSAAALAAANIKGDPANLVNNINNSEETSHPAGSIPGLVSNNPDSIENPNTIQEGSNSSQMVRPLIHSHYSQPQQALHHPMYVPNVADPSHNHHMVYLQQQGQYQPIHYQPYRNQIVQNPQLSGQDPDTYKTMQRPTYSSTPYETPHYYDFQHSQVPPNYQDPYRRQTTHFVGNSTHGAQSNSDEYNANLERWDSSQTLQADNNITLLNQSAVSSIKGSPTTSKGRRSSKSSVSSPNIKYEVASSTSTSSSPYSHMSGSNNSDYETLDHSKNSKSVTKRSRMGCLTCRQRKKRCSESKPNCYECSRLRLKCVWPKPGTEHKNKSKEIKEEENTIDHEIYGKIKVLRGIVEYRSS